MHAQELHDELLNVPPSQRTSLENLLMVSVERGRISSSGAALEELAQVRHDKAGLADALRGIIEDSYNGEPSLEVAKRIARAALNEYGCKL